MGSLDTDVIRGVLSSTPCVVDIIHCFLYSQCYCKFIFRRGLRRQGTMSRQLLRGDSESTSTSSTLSTSRRTQTGSRRTGTGSASVTGHSRSGATSRIGSRNTQSQSSGLAMTTRPYDAGYSSNRSSSFDSREDTSSLHRV